MRRRAFFSGNSRLFYFRITVYSLLGVGIIFFAMPALELMLRDAQKVFIRPVEVTVPVVRPVPPPPPQPEKIVKKVKVRGLAKPKLRIPTPKTPAPAKINASLPVETMNLSEGDFTLNFDMAPSVTDTDFVFQLEDVHQAPVVLKRVTPLYPFKAKDRGIEGSVTLYFVINPDGRVRTETIEVMEADPVGIFEDSAIHAVEKWLFEPGKRDGTPVPVLMTVTVVFNLT